MEQRQRREALRADAADRRRATVGALAADPRVALSPCEDYPAWLCGTVPVPFDRAKPHGRQLGLAVAVLPHSDPSSTRTDAVFATDGGPGASNLAARDFLEYINDGLTADRDLVVVDHRGTGSSGVIDCPWLQANLGDPYVDHQTAITEIGKCGKSLGADADRYGSGDIAMDLDAVRAALGYPRINLYGLSYGGTFLSAYATRYPHRLRALVIDAGTPATDPLHKWTWGTDIPPTMAKLVGLNCRRAPACAAAQPDAGTALARLAAAVRKHPVSGTVNVSGLGPRKVTVTEQVLATNAYENLDQAELAAVATAFERGDKKPLLRLGGETLWPVEPDDLAVSSNGANVATFCNDNDFVWNRTDSIRVRKAKYARALADLGPRAFAPFSAQAWSDRFLSDYCLYWPAPDRFTPANPKGVQVTAVPTLILSGDFDTIVPTATTRELLRIFPRATFAPIAGAGHPSAGWSDCARLGQQEFQATFSAAAVKDCDEPAWVWEATSKFLKTSVDATAARPRAGDQSTLTDRKVAATVVQTVRDVWLRSYRIPGDFATVYGLRGGTSQVDWSVFPFGNNDMDGIRFAHDVAVSGSSFMDYSISRTTFDVRVDGPGGVDGALRAEGGLGGNIYEDFAVTGNLGGHRIEVSVPAN
jgi:pimeloyl-ACP methyl ester carboxylesterase